MTLAVNKGEVEGSIAIDDFKRILNENPASIHIIDVRDGDEFKTGAFPTAVNIPVDELENQIKELPADKPIVFVCSTGARSGESFYMLQDLRPELKKIFYLEAQLSFKKDGTYDIKASVE